MADKLGVLFLNAAMGPLNYAGQCIMQSRVEQGLRELAAESLLGAAERGIAAVASSAGLPTSYVENLLPMIELRQVAGRIADNQRAALSQWQLHTGHVGGLLDGIADLTIDNRPPDASLCLLRVSKKMQLDKELALPLRQLSEDLVTWQELLVSCRTFIDDGRSIAAAYRQRRLIRFGAAVAGALAVAVVVVWLVRVQRARDRIDAALAGDDPCVAESVDVSDEGKASDEQRARLGALKTSCEEGREDARRAEEAERAATAQRLEEEEAKRARIASCEKLETTLAQGAAEVGELPEAAPHRELLGRMAQGKLEPDDVSKLASFPCLDTAAAKGLSERYLRAALATAAVWLGSAAPSKVARELMVKGKEGASERQLTIFGRHVEELAKKAVRTGKTDLLARVTVLCALNQELGVHRGQHCEAAATVRAPD